jgi:hypothetical protein
MSDESFLNKLHESAVMASDLTGTEREWAAGIENMFTFFVDQLRNHPSSLEVREMAASAWEVLHHGHVLTMIHSGVPTLAQVIAGRELRQAYILIPVKWPEMVAKDLVGQLGGVVFVLSQAVDAYNNVSVEGMKARALAFEGALLRTLDIQNPSGWQAQAMSSPPPETFAYERRQVVPPS